MVPPIGRYLAWVVLWYPKTFFFSLLFFVFFKCDRFIWNRKGQVSVRIKYKTRYTIQFIKWSFIWIHGCCLLFYLNCVTIVDHVLKLDVHIKLVCINAIIQRPPKNITWKFPVKFNWSRSSPSPFGFVSLHTHTHTQC